MSITIVTRRAVFVIFIGAHTSGCQSIGISFHIVAETIFTFSQLIEPVEFLPTFKLSFYFTFKLVRVMFHTLTMFEDL